MVLNFVPLTLNGTESDLWIRNTFSNLYAIKELVFWQKFTVDEVAGLRTPESWLKAVAPHPEEVPEQNLVQLPEQFWDLVYLLHKVVPLIQIDFA